jgi:TPR repeat protein
MDDMRNSFFYDPSPGVLACVNPNGAVLYDKDARDLFNRIACHGLGPCSSSECIAQELDNVDALIEQYTNNRDIKHRDEDLLHRAVGRLTYLHTVHRSSEAALMLCHTFFLTNKIQSLNWLAHAVNQGHPVAQLTYAMGCMRSPDLYSQLLARKLLMNAATPRSFAHAPDHFFYSQLAARYLQGNTNTLSEPRTIASNANDLVSDLDESDNNKASNGASVTASIPITHDDSADHHSLVEHLSGSSEGKSSSLLQSMASVPVSHPHSEDYSLEQLVQLVALPNSVTRQHIDRMVSERFTQSPSSIWSFIADNGTHFGLTNREITDALISFLDTHKTLVSTEDSIASLLLEKRKTIDKRIVRHICTQLLHKGLYNKAVDCFNCFFTKDERDVLYKELFDTMLASEAYADLIERIVPRINQQYSLEILSSLADKKPTLSVKIIMLLQNVTASTLKDKKDALVAQIITTYISDESLIRDSGVSLFKQLIQYHGTLVAQERNGIEELFYNYWDRLQSVVADGVDPSCYISNSDLASGYVTHLFDTDKEKALLFWTTFVAKASSADIWSMLAKIPAKKHKQPLPEMVFSAIYKEGLMLGANKEHVQRVLTDLYPYIKDDNSKCRMILKKFSAFAQNNNLRVTDYISALGPRDPLGLHLTFIGYSQGKFGYKLSPSMAYQTALDLLALDAIKQPEHQYLLQCDLSESAFIAQRINDIVTVYQRLQEDSKGGAASQKISLLLCGIFERCVDFFKQKKLKKEDLPHLISIASIVSSHIDSKNTETAKSLVSFCQKVYQEFKQNGLNDSGYQMLETADTIASCLHIENSSEGQEIKLLLGTESYRKKNMDLAVRCLGSIDFGTIVIKDELTADATAYYIQLVLSRHIAAKDPSGLILPLIDKLVKYNPSYGEGGLPALNKMLRAKDEKGIANGRWEFVKHYLNSPKLIEMMVEYSNDQGMMDNLEALEQSKIITILEKAANNHNDPNVYAAYALSIMLHYKLSIKGDDQLDKETPNRTEVIRYINRTIDLIESNKARELNREAIAQAYYLKGLYCTALSVQQKVALQKALGYDPDNGKVHYTLARLYATMSNNHERKLALKHFTIAHEKGIAEATLQLITTYALTDQSKSYELLSKFVSEHGRRFPHSLVMLGDWYKEGKKPLDKPSLETALQYYKQAADCGYFDGYVRLCQHGLQSGDTSLAQSFLDFKDFGNDQRFMVLKIALTIAKGEVDIAHAMLQDSRCIDIPVCPVGNDTIAYIKKDGIDAVERNIDLFREIGSLDVLEKIGTPGAYKILGYYHATAASLTKAKNLDQYLQNPTIGLEDSLKALKYYRLTLPTDDLRIVDCVTMLEISCNHTLIFVDPETYCQQLVTIFQQRLRPLVEHRLKMEHPNESIELLNEFLNEMRTAKSLYASDKDNRYAEHVKTIEAFLTVFYVFLDTRGYDRQDYTIVWGKNNDQK